MAIVETVEPSHEASHAHGEFIAHHFDSPRQQFDSGKLGIWLFLATEILFFSGLFCAYTLYRVHHPEIFAQASTFLDKVLGGMNTIVLLFSSLTMALAVRYSQMADNRKVVVFLTITMVCAAIFLGIKAVEYSHKWDEGIFTRAYFHFHEHGGLGVSNYLTAVSIPFGVALVLALAGGIVAKFNGKSDLGTFLICVAVMFSGYFLGAVGGKLYMNSKSVAERAKVEHLLHEDVPTPTPAASLESEAPAAQGESAAKPDAASAAQTIKSDADTAAETAKTQTEGAPQTTKTDADETPQTDKTQTVKTQTEGAPQTPPKTDGAGAAQTAKTDTQGAGENGNAQAEPAPAAAPETATASQGPIALNHDIGVFFSIYYCMTGLHAFHVFGGMVALSWLLWRSLKGHWRVDYFGPVDFVGLYWHIVDIIWIFLFPLLYLIH